MMVANEPPFFLPMPGSGGWGQSHIMKRPTTAEPQTAGRGSEPQPRTHKDKKKEKWERSTPIIDKKNLSVYAEK